MCGIAGIFVTNKSRINDAALHRLARSLLVAIQTRGSDATGYVYLNKHGNTCLAKAPVTAKSFVDIPGHLLSKKKAEMPQLILLHARFATHGEASNNMNNHPLYSKVSGLSLIHNGWLLNDTELETDFELKKDAEVDTETYLRLIEKFYFQGETKSVESGIKEATKLVYGAVVCAMIRGGKPGVMWLWRDKGDLAVVQTEWGYVFASTMTLLLNSLYDSCHASDVASFRRFYIPQASLVRFELGKKPKLFGLEAIDWNNAGQFKTQIYTTEINGETKIRRNKGNVYCYNGYGDNFGGNVNNGTTIYHGNRQSGYIAPTRSGLPVVVGSTPNQTDSDSKEGSDNTGGEKSDAAEPQRIHSHPIQCYCDPCVAWWNWKIEHPDVGNGKFNFGYGE